MTRVVPAGVRREIDRSESEDFFLVFLTIEHEELPEPIRIVSDPVDFNLDGDLFTGFVFSVRPLTDSEGAPYAELAVQNVDQRIGGVLLNIQNPPRLKMEIVSGTEFDLSVEPRTTLSAPAARTYVAEELYLVNVSIDTLQVKGRLRSWDYSQELWPGIMATQDRLPGLFR